MVNVNYGVKKLEAYMVDGLLDNVVNEYTVIPDNQRVSMLKYLSTNELRGVLSNLRVDLFKGINQCVGDSFTMIDSNPANTKDADAAIKTLDERIYNLEFKFGKETNGNWGMSTMYEIVPELKTPLEDILGYNSRMKRIQAIKTATDYNQQAIIESNEIKRHLSIMADSLPVDLVTGNESTSKLNNAFMNSGSIHGGNGYPTIKAYFYKNHVDVKLVEIKDSQYKIGFNFTNNGADRLHVNFYGDQGTNAMAILNNKNNVKLMTIDGYHKFISKQLLGSPSFIVKVDYGKG